MTTNITTTTETTTVVVEENIVRIELNNIGVQGVPGANNDPVYVTVRNATGSLIAKGSIVYVSGGNGTHTQVTKALATGDSTSARTLGWLAADIANNADGLCMVEGYLDGVNTQGVAEGSQLYLSGTVAGAFQVTKPVAPIHLVYVGVCVKASAGNGRVYVKVQNGYELGELHDVLIVSPTNNQVLAYDSATSLWKNATNAPDGVTSITATSPLTGGTITSTGSIGLNQALLSITRSQVSDFTSGTVTSASTAQQSGTAVFATTSGSAVTITGTITRSQVSDFTSGTVAEATNASTAVNVSGSAITRSQISDFTSGTVASAGFATTSGTSVSISGSITRSQVSDYAAGTVANISGTVTQSQVTNLVSDLALKAPLASPTFSGTVTLPFASSGLLVSGTAGAVTKTDAAPDLGYFPSTGTGAAGYVWNQLSNYARRDQANAFTVGGHSITSEGTAIVPLVLKGASGQTADLFQAQTNAGTVVSKVTANGALAVNNQTTAADSILIQRAGATHLRVDPFNNMFATGTMTVGQDSTAGSIRLGVYAGSATTIGAVIRGAASQSASLLELQNSAGTVRSSVSSAGYVYGVGLYTNGSEMGFETGNGGGRMKFTRCTSLPSNQGANQAIIYFRDGTTAGTLKLVVRAGAAGAETTILDNIPQ
jgi:hypothetical protein